ncbi:hypothetical protein PoB_002005800 [Plakobranchus ocellatus]|uniref:Uncharacterized protein n=1 Tax=Plakobranchus ocellatus TaxID=259542 RepID=A0AAV3ZG33_9GAST|nr:hypothetical protein PoB_002005800 [Plakobranchus ocellatus]
MLELKPAIEESQQISGRLHYPLSHRRTKWILVNMRHSILAKGFGGTWDSESALRSTRTLLTRVRDPSPVPWTDGVLET